MTGDTTRILGIDPGSQITGYGVIELAGQQTRFIACGAIRVKANAGDAIGDKLKFIFESVSEVIAQYQPDESAIEQVFLAKNADSALKLGQARGAALVALATHDLPIAEYTAKRVKQSVVGKGAATKDQVQHMVKMLLSQTITAKLGKSGHLQADAADALAIALCHAQHRGVLGGAYEGAYEGVLATTHARNTGRSSSWRKFKVN